MSKGFSLKGYFFVLLLPSIIVLSLTWQALLCKSIKFMLETDGAFLYIFMCFLCPLILFSFLRLLLNMSCDSALLFVHVYIRLLLLMGIFFFSLSCVWKKRKEKVTTKNENVETINKLKSTAIYSRIPYPFCLIPYSIMYLRLPYIHDRRNRKREENVRERKQHFNDVIFWWMCLMSLFIYSHFFLFSLHDIFIHVRENGSYRNG